MLWKHFVNHGVDFEERDWANGQQRKIEEI
jgi:hypothetical protein